MQSDNLRLEVAQVKGGIPLIRVCGTLDSYNFRILQEAFEKIFQNGQASVLVDLSELLYASSAGIGVMVGAAANAHSKGGSVVLVSPKEEVREVLSLIGVTHIMPIASNLEEAIRSLAETLPHP